MQVLDRDELELPFEGPTIFRDIEGEEELFAEPWAFRRSYQNAMKEFLEGVRQECGARGYDHVQFLTDEPLGASLSYLLAFPCRRPAGPSVRARDHNMMTFLSPLLIWGTLLGRDPPHHPPAEPPTVPPGGMGADALSQADDSAQSAADPARAALLLLLRIALPVLLFFYLARPVVEPDGAGAMAGHRRPLEPGRPDRRLDEHGLCGRRGAGLPAGAAGGGRRCWPRFARKTTARW